MTTCECKNADKLVQYTCDCGACDCGTIVEFDAMPNVEPFCCGKPMKRIK